MIVHDLNIDRPLCSLRPLKTYPPLVIDTDTVLALAVPPECLQMITGQVQVKQRHYRFELVELHFRLMFNTLKGFNPVSYGKRPGPLVSEAQDHLLL